MKRTTILLYLLLVCTCLSSAQYYPNEGFLLLSKDEEILGAEHISMITYLLPLEPGDANKAEIVHTLAEQSKAANGNVVKLLSLKTIVPGDSFLCYAIVMKVPDPANVNYINLDDFYFVIVDELIEHPETQSKAYFFTSPLPGNSLLEGDRGIVMTMEDSFSCFFEKNTVCSHTKSVERGGDLFYFMMAAERDKMLEPLEMHYKDGYHICKVYEKMNALKKE